MEEDDLLFRLNNSILEVLPVARLRLLTLVRPLLRLEQYRVPELKLGHLPLLEER